MKPSVLCSNLLVPIHFNDLFMLPCKFESLTLFKRNVWVTSNTEKAKGENRTGMSRSPVMGLSSNIKFSLPPDRVQKGKTLFRGKYPHEIQN